MPPHAWTPTGTGDWIVLRVAPLTPSSLGAAGAATTAVVEVTARWALAGTQLRTFGAPLDILLPASATGVLPGRLVNGTWRAIEPLATPGVLPAGATDGWYRDGAGIHVLTRTLSVFGLIRDVEPPEPPSVGGIVDQHGLTLRWAHGRDNSGLVGGVDLYVNGVHFQTFGPTELEANLGPADADDTRAFTLVQRDAAGNASAPTPRVVVIPQVAGRTLGDAEAILAGRGFSVGRVTERQAAAPAGTVIEPAGVFLAPQGSPVDLVVSSGTATPQPPQARLTLAVTQTIRFSWKERSFLAVRLTTTRASAVTGTLVSPSGQRVYTWRTNVKAGSNVLRLKMPKQVRRAGVYRLVITAQSGGETVRRTVRVEIVANTKQARRAAVPPTRPVEIVLTGSPELQKEIALGLRRSGTRVLESDAERAFALTGNRSRNVQVVVVDVASGGMPLVRDLRLVFPGVRIVALVRTPQEQAAAMRNGASVALPRSAPPAQVARAIARLARAR